MTDPMLPISDRRLARLHAYWLEKKGERAAPSRADIAPEEIKDILPWVFLVESVGERYRVRLAGSAIAEEYGAELTGKYLDEIDLDAVTAHVIGDHRTVAREVAPLIKKWSFTKNDGRYLDYELLILPLSSDGKVVDMFLCGAIGFGFG